MRQPTYRFKASVALMRDTGWKNQHFKYILSMEFDTTWSLRFCWSGLRQYIHKGREAPVVCVHVPFFILCHYSFLNFSFFIHLAFGLILWNGFWSFQGKNLCWKDHSLAPHCSRMLQELERVTVWNISLLKTVRHQALQEQIELEQSGFPFRTGSPALGAQQGFLLGKKNNLCKCMVTNHQVLVAELLLLLVLFAVVLSCCLLFGLGGGSCDFLWLVLFSLARAGKIKTSEKVCFTEVKNGSLGKNA